MNGIFKHRTTRSKSVRSKAALRFWQVWPLWLIFGAFLVLGVAALITVTREGRPQRKDDTSEIKLSAGQDLRLALDKFEAGRLYLFSQASEQGQRLRFVVQRTSDGVFHADLASCKACYRTEHLHYIQNGQVMCGMCNHPMHRPEEKGLTPLLKRCALVTLPHSVKDGQVVVRADDVVAQTRATEAK